MRAKTIIMLTVAALALSSPAIAAGSGASSGLPSTSRPAVDPAEAYQEGIAALQAKDYKTAEKKFGDVLSVVPKNPEANYYMAVSKIGNGKPKNAVRYLEKAIKERPNFVEARERLGLVSIELGKPDVAQEQLAAIEGLKSDCAAAGDCDSAYNERVDTAIARLQEALAKVITAAPTDDGAEGEESETDDASAEEEQTSLFFAPRDEGVRQYLAAVRLINEGDYRAAIDDLRQAAAIVGPHPDILNYLGYSHRKLGLMSEARGYYAEALAIDPDHKGANEYLGELYLEIGETAKAKAQLARLDRICAFGCAEREDLARLIERREGALAAK